jgi:predicted nuclease of predicted toxin-antitoxin system
MRAKLDENLPVEAAELLRTAGWECDSVYDEGLAGADDPEVAAVCQAGARVLFTLDGTVGAGAKRRHRDKPLLMSMCSAVRPYTCQCRRMSSIAPSSFRAMFCA